MHLWKMWQSVEFKNEMFGILVQAPLATYHRFFGQALKSSGSYSKWGGEAYLLSLKKAEVFRRINAGKATKKGKGKTTGSC